MSDAQVNQGYRSGIGSAGMQVPAAPKPANPSCFGNIEDVTDSCRSAAERVERVVARLCGEVEQAPVGSNPNVPQGLFEAADQQARDIRTCMDRIFRACERLEGQLP